MAETYVGQANARLQTAGRACKARNYAFAVRQSQECVELSLKAALRLYGVEYPCEHDVKSVLSEVAHRFPKWFSEQVKEFGKISEQLAKVRGPSMYGDEEKGIPPTELFNKKQAQEALKDAKFVNNQCRRLLSEFRRARRGRL